MRINNLKLISILICVSIAAILQAQSNTWTGTVDRDWHKSCNWSLNAIPNCSHDVTIPNTGNKPLVTGIAHCHSIHVISAAGAYLEVKSSIGAKVYVSSNSGSCAGTPTDNSSSGCCQGVGSTAFNYNGGQQSWVVPACVTAINYDVRGAQGGACLGGTDRGGYGGRITGSLSVTPGETIYFYVGGAGGNGVAYTGGSAGYNGGGTGDYTLSFGPYAGGGGGGASDIRQGGNGVGNRVVVAGGGGGGAYNYYPTNNMNDNDRGGNGGGSTGENGYSNFSTIQGSYGELPGGGGSQSAGGSPGYEPNYCYSNAGTFATGGNGGGFGGNCSSIGTSGGGGGGGYYGGGGGTWTGGGGGSNYPAAGTQGFQGGNGYIAISW